MSKAAAVPGPRLEPSRSLGPGISYMRDNGSRKRSICRRTFLQRPERPLNPSASLQNRGLGQRESRRWAARLALTAGRRSTDLGMSSGASESSFGRYLRRHAKSLIGNPGKLKEPRFDDNSSRSSSRNTGCCTAAAACVASAAFRMVSRTPAVRRSGSQRSPVGRDQWVLIECSRWQRRPSQGRRDSDTHVCAPSLLDMATGLLPVRPCGYTYGDDPVH